jgi:hypothetical protein
MRSEDAQRNGSKHPVDDAHVEEFRSATEQAWLHLHQADEDRAPYLCYTREPHLDYAAGAIHTALVEHNAQIALLIRSDQRPTMCGYDKTILPMRCFLMPNHEGKHIGCRSDDIEEYGLHVVRVASWSPGSLSALRRTIDMWRKASIRASSSSDPFERLSSAPQV